MSTVLPSQNRDWGFWGTMGEHAASAWPIAFDCVLSATQAEPDAVRAFLDSRHGRYFADGVNNQMHFGASLTDAVAKTAAEWMSEKISRSTSRETGIPVGLPLLVGLVIDAGITAEVYE